MTNNVKSVKQSQSSRGKANDTHQAQREQRVLDAASSLICRLGYDKTTMDDIAREAGVSKGAVYLHVPSKEALLESLLMREMHGYASQWIAVVQNEADGGTMGGMFRAMLLALADHPLMSAMLREDSQVFGSYLRKPDTLFRKQGGRNTRAILIEQMQLAGAVREDIDPIIAAHILKMLSYGLISMGQIMPEDQIPELSPLVDAIASMLDGWMTPLQGFDPEAGKALVRQMVEAAQASDKSEHRG